MSEVKKTIIKEEKSGSKKGLIIFFVILLLAINGVSLFYNFKQNTEIKEKESIIVQKDAQRDSLTTALNDKIAELKNIQAQLDSAGVKTADLEAQITELQTLRDKLQKDAKYKGLYFSIKDEIDNANKLKDASEAKVRALEMQLAQQDTIIQQKNVIITQKEQSIVMLEQEKTELSEKVAIASVLKAENINVIAISTKGKEKIGSVYKAKAIDKVKISFTISENKVAVKNNKELFIRIVEPDGAAVFSMESGGGEFVYNNKSIYYTLKHSILFNGMVTPVSLDYAKGSPYKPGKHIVEVYCEGSLIGSGAFTVE